jgi:hypothetical protein
MNSKINTATASPGQFRTVKQIRDALTTLPAEADDLPLAICVPLDDDSYVTYAITEGPSYQKVDWGHGLVEDKRYVIIEAFTDLLPLRDRLEFYSSDEEPAGGRMA